MRWCIFSYFPVVLFVTWHSHVVVCVCLVLDGDDGIERVCDTLLMCIITVLNQGLRNGGGVGDILRRPSKEAGRLILSIWITADTYYSLLLFVLAWAVCKWHLYWWVFSVFFHPGASVCCSSSLRPPVLLRRYHHRPESHLWCYHWHLRWLEEWETAEGGDPENHLFHLRCVQLCGSHITACTTAAPQQCFK